MYLPTYVAIISFKELIATAIEQAELKVLRNACAKDENLECSTSWSSPIELEWCGTEYSRKFESLLSYESLSTSDEQLQIKYKAAVAQGVCFKEFICTCTHTHTHIHTHTHTHTHNVVFISIHTENKLRDIVSILIIYMLFCNKCNVWNLQQPLCSKVMACRSSSLHDELWMYKSHSDGFFSTTVVYRSSDTSYTYVTPLFYDCKLHTLNKNILGIEKVQGRSEAAGRCDQKL